MSIKSKLAKIEAKLQIGVTQHVQILNNFQYLVNDFKKKPYIPNKTGLKFHADNFLVRLIMGPYGSGKTTICCSEILFRACSIPPCLDGIRRSRWAIVRNTYGDLEATTLKTWLEWFAGLGIVYHKMSPRLQYKHTFNDGAGLIELELMFIALDRPDQIRRLKSLELTGVYFNELSEIPQAAFTHFKGRIKRFPAPRDRSAAHYWFGMIADTNPPEVDHWIYKIFEIDRPAKHVAYHQPPGMLKIDDGYEINIDADNYNNLDHDYYSDMMLGQTEEFIKVYILGQYGTVIEGKFVYANYNDDLHSVERLDIDKTEPILLAWDYGTISPACLAAQLVGGHLYIIKEFVCEYMTPKELYNVSVKPWLIKHAKSIPLEVIGDPADTYDGKEQLEECGLLVEAAKTNNIEARIRAVKDALNVLIQGKTKFLLSREGCPKLRQGFLGKYNYRRLRVIGEERYQDVPNKSHPYSDIHDCLQYAALHFADLELYESDMDYEVEDIYEEGKSAVGGY